MNEPVASPRRRFRFSLHTVFVLVTLLGIGCAFVARERAIVREREAVIDWLASQKPTNTGFKWLGNIAPLKGPFWRRWLGERWVLTSASYSPDVTQDEIDRVRAAFPEATVEPRPE